MTNPLVAIDAYFTPFDKSIENYLLPEKFTFPFEYTPHPLCLLAVEKLQIYIQKQKEWEHNFGLEQGKAGIIIGKMFGVLLVKTRHNEIGFIAAFSGKLAGGYHHSKFVPPVFDALTKGSFLNVGMEELTRINQEIKTLQESKSAENIQKTEALKKLRKKNSSALQEKLFDQYYFLNQAGKAKNLRDVFQKNSNKNPPSGAGECAAPKLLHYAFQNNMKPLAMAEFWWGLSPKSAFWKHGHFYPACREKCEPILSHMLEGMELDEIRK
ncbi:MAG TPA: pseudouridylate synthase [Bacteroidia bacterium]|nr:pseudouridylate synthase [Bacteroidia bacterium]